MLILTNRLSEDVVLNRLDNCCKEFISFRCSSCEERFSIPLRCDLILCDNCGKRRFKRLKEKYLPVLKQFNNIKFLTLTWKKGTEDKGVILLRHRQTRRLIKKYFKGGIYVFEGLAQHIHALVVGGYVSKYQLSKSWKKITKHSKIIRIRKANSDALNYVLKYISKTPTTDRKDFYLYYNFWYKQRRVSTVGFFYNYKYHKLMFEMVCNKCKNFLIFCELTQTDYGSPLYQKTVF